MMNSNQIDPSTLVLKMVGGPLDGKLLPISTQKCFLTGGENQNENQCAIIRGPSGTAIKSTGDAIVVNDHTDHLHWLRQGDTIKIGQTHMIVEQLGCYGQVAVPAGAVMDTSASESSAQQIIESLQVEEPNSDLTPSVEPAPTHPTSDSSNAAEVVEQTHSETQPDPVNESEVEPPEAVENHCDEVDLPAGTVEQVNQILERLEAAQAEAQDQPQSPVQPDASDASETPVESGPDGSQSELQAFLANAGSLPAGTVKDSAEQANSDTQAESFVAPAQEDRQALTDSPDPSDAPVGHEDTTEEAHPVPHSDPESEKRMSSELLERALRSLEVGQETTSPETPQDVPVTPMSVDSSPVPSEEAEVAPLTQESAAQPDPALDSPQLPSLSEILGRVPEEAHDPTHLSLDESNPADTLEEFSSEIADSHPPHDQHEETMPTQLDEAPAQSSQNSSVADVLARMKSQGQLDDFNMPSVEQEESAPEVPSAPVMPIDMPVPQAAPAAEEGGESSVQDYMNQLFQRLRGTDAPKTEEEVAVEQEAEIQAQVEEVQPQECKDADRILSASEYVPQQQAPEEKSDLEAMRQLANKQKQAAVQISTFKKSQLDLTFNQCVGLSSLVAAVVLGWMSPSLTDSLFKAAFGCLCISFIAGFRYYTLIRKDRIALTKPAENAAETVEQSDADPAEATA